MEQNILNYLSIKLSGCTRNPEKESCIAPEIHPADQMMSFYTAKNIRVIKQKPKPSINTGLSASTQLPKYVFFCPHNLYFISAKLHSMNPSLAFWDHRSTMPLSYISYISRTYLHFYAYQGWALLCCVCMFSWCSGFSYPQKHVGSSLLSWPKGQEHHNQRLIGLQLKLTPGWDDDSPPLWIWQMD